MTGPQWRPGTFLDNFNTAAVRLGYMHLPIAWGLAKVPWKSVEDRDAFLDALTRVKPGDQ